MAALIIQDLLANGTGDRKPMSVDAVKEELRTRTSKLTLRDTPVEEFASPDAVDTAGMKGERQALQMSPRAFLTTSRRRATVRAPTLSKQRIRCLRHSRYQGRHTPHC